MNGYTPWEVALLKRRYHNFDGAHKGFLDVSDMRILCDAAGITRHGAAEDLFSRMDRDHDDELTFPELATFLASTPTEEAARLRAYFLHTDATVLAGGSLGALLNIMKMKAGIAAGAFFADPIRLFRDYYVEYTASIRAHKTVGKRASFVAAMKKLGLLSGSGWFIFSVILDSCVGVAMFLTYAHVRAQLADAGIMERVRDRLFNGETSQQQRRVRLLGGGNRLDGEQLMLEAGAGLAAGAVSGVLEVPAQAIAASHLRFRELPGALRKTSQQWGLRIMRSSLAHAAFFTGFYTSRTLGSYAAYDVAGIHHTSFADAILTAAAGCGAGATFRVVAVPIDNWIAVRRSGSRRAEFRQMGLGGRRRLLFGGLGSSLAFTMPITGFVFLGYEFALMYL